MIAPRWDAPAVRAVRCAEALFAAADLGWFVQSGRQGEDPWSAFDHLIRAALSTSGHEPPAGEPVLPAGSPVDQAATALPRRTPTAVSDETRRSATHGGPALAERASGSSMARFFADNHVTTRATSTAIQPVTDRNTPPTAVRPRRAVAPAAVAPRSVERMPSRAVPSEPSIVGALRASARSSSADTVPSLSPASVPSALGARILDVLDASRAETPTAPASTHVSSSPDVGSLSTPAVPPAGEAGTTRTASLPARPSGTTRLVDGLPALQNLMQAAVAESRARHDRMTADPAPGPVPMRPSLVTPLQLVPPAMRALPEIDEVAEDMLVDRLCDRLQERLREQALRQFGFTGGLV